MKDAFRGHGREKRHRESEGGRGRSRGIQAERECGSLIVVSDEPLRVKSFYLLISLPQKIGATVAERLARSSFSIPSRATGFSQVGIVPDDAAGRRVFSGICRFPCPFIPASLHTNLNHPTSALKTSPKSLHSLYELNSHRTELHWLNYIFRAYVLFKDGSNLRSDGTSFEEKAGVGEKNPGTGGKSGKRERHAVLPRGNSQRRYISTVATVTLVHSSRRHGNPLTNSLSPAKTMARIPCKIAGEWAAKRAVQFEHSQGRNVRMCNVITTVTCRRLPAGDPVPKGQDGEFWSGDDGECNFFYASLSFLTLPKNLLLLPIASQTQKTEHPDYTLFNCITVASSRDSGKLEHPIITRSLPHEPLRQVEVTPKFLLTVEEFRLHRYFKSPTLLRSSHATEPLPDRMSQVSQNLNVFWPSGIQLLDRTLAPRPAWMCELRTLLRQRAPTYVSGSHTSCLDTDQRLPVGHPISAWSAAVTNPAKEDPLAQDADPSRLSNQEGGGRIDDYREERSETPSTNPSPPAKRDGL
ncbi:hypothetical protein PR048_024812 [Dryococelus australis]|uniref:Uncharacterized protein n=1 Tax=Dryococelus australis TaxID=614101 RepID=A0ABQ9GPK3_9NEOP|nr:hypothetical protein PR048_024812 [Dryococelus australis]